MKRVLSIILALTMMFTLTFSLGMETSATSLTEEATTMNSRVREIPEGAFLYKEGLYIKEGVTATGTIKWELYSADGWCFYDLQQPENYVDGDVEGGVLVPENQRVYAQYRIMRKNEEYVTNNIICVPVQDGYEIVSVGGNNNHEVM